MTCSRAPAASLLAASLLAAPLLALASSGLVGCGSDGSGGDPPPPEPAEQPRVVLGSGREAFEPVAPGGSVPLIRGIQGGFHVWTSFLVYGFDTDVVRMDLTTSWDEVDESLLEMKGNMSLDPVTDPSGAPALVSLGWPASIFKPACANGRRLDLSITVVDMAAGISASDARDWVVEVAEEDRAQDCPP